MIGKPIALIQVPNQRLFSPKAASRYLDVHPQTLKKITDEGQLQAKWMRNRKFTSWRNLTVTSSRLRTIIHPERG